MKIPYILFFLLSATINLVRPKCIHDEIIKNHTMYRVNDSHIHQRRLLQPLAYGPLRLHYQYNTTTVSDTDPIGKNLRKIMNIIGQFWSQTIQIDYLPALSFQIGVPYFSVMCGDYNVPQNIVKVPTPNKDFGIFISAQDDGDTGVTAYSMPCSSSSVDKRPLWGFIHWNKHYLSFNPINFQQNLHIGIHQVLHILGFSRMLYGSYKNSQIFVTSNGAAYLKGPFINKQVTRQYNCPNPPGMTLQSGGGQGTSMSHWSRKVAHNQFMTAGVSVNNPTISYITLALLEQTGWYRKIYKDLGNFINYGYKKGCSILDSQGCGSNQYCKIQDEKRPDYDRTALGYCKNDSLSNCLYIKFYINFICTDPNYAEKSLHADQGVVNVTGQIGGMKSRCYSSDLRLTGQPPTKYAFRCYQTTCSATRRTLTLKIGNKLAFCMFPNQLLRINGYEGTVRCPDSFAQSCAIQRCQDQCNANGICLGGRCLCDPNFVGPSCSQPKILGLGSTVDRITSSQNNNCMVGSYRTQFGDCQPCQKGCAKCTQKQCQLCLGGTLPINNTCKVK